MARIFRKKRIRYLVGGRRVSAVEAKRLEAEGHLVERRIEPGAKWYIRYVLPDGRVREVPGYTDKTATLAKALELERSAQREAMGLAKPADRYLADPVDKHLADYVADLTARGRTVKHVRLTVSRIRQVLDLGGVRRLGDVTGARVTGALAELRSEGLAIETVNHHLVAGKMFTRWLWKQGRLAEDPLAGLSRQNADVDRRRVRRALGPDEIGRLVQATERSLRVFRGLDGLDRAALYTLAAFSGLRAQELASLTAGDLNLAGNPPTVTVQAAYAKNRRQDVLPLPPDVAEYLSAWLGARPTKPVGETRLWPSTWWRRAAAMLRADLAEAGIGAERFGQVLDFHALRATYATALARLGCNLQTAQALLRHSDPKLTARTYTKLGVTDLGQAVAGLTLQRPSEAEKTEGAE